MSKDLDSLLKEKRIFEPSKTFVEETNIKKWMDKHDISDYDDLLEKAADNPEWFWDDIATELEWYKPYKKTFKWNPPHAEWFLDGKFNIIHNALDRHAKGSNKNKTAFLWESESGDVRSLSYYELYLEVNKFANALKSLGIGKGDTVSIYLPMIPELPIAMLACAKLVQSILLYFQVFGRKHFKTG